MQTSRLLPFVPVLGLALSLPAQAPDYRMQPAVKLGSPMRLLVLGQPGQPFATLLDIDGGPRTIAERTFWLGLRALTVLHAGTLDPLGAFSASLPTPNQASLSGVALYGQALVLPRTGPFELSPGESTILHQGSAAIVEDFRDPVASGITGTYDRSVKRRLMAVPPTRRVVSTIKPLNRLQWLFPQPIPGPLNKYGTRVQMVFRASDLGATGNEEVITAIRWRPFNRTVVDDRFARLNIRVSHTSVVPDFTVDRFSALPMFPDSGLDLKFDNNVKQSEKLVSLYDGPYSIRKADLRPDGYLSFPTPQTGFVYNGFNSLLLDFRMAPSPTSSGANGAELYLMVQSSPKPYSLIQDYGTATNTVDPFKSSVAQTGGSTVFDYQIELARTISVAQSPFLQAPKANPDYQQPAIAASIPAGTSIEVEYRGALTAAGGSASYWATTIDQADGMPYVQYRVTFTSDYRTDAVPSIDTLVIPIK